MPTRASLPRTATPLPSERRARQTFIKLWYLGGAYLCSVYVPFCPVFRALSCNLGIVGRRFRRTLGTHRGAVPARQTKTIVPSRCRAVDGTGTVSYLKTLLFCQERKARGVGHVTQRFVMLYGLLLSLL